MQIFLQRIIKLFCFINLLSFPILSFSTAQVTVKNFCDQPVTLIASDEIACEPSGVEILKKPSTPLHRINSGAVIVCSPLTDDGQSSYTVQPDQQDTPRDLLPQSYDLPEGGELIWYCVNSGPLGPCECRVPVQSTI